MSTFVYQVSKGCIYQKGKKCEKLFNVIFLVEIYDRRKSNLYEKIRISSTYSKIVSLDKNMRSFMFFRIPHITFQNERSCSHPSFLPVSVHNTFMTFHVFPDINPLSASYSSQRKLDETFYVLEKCVLTLKIFFQSFCMITQLVLLIIP